MAYFQGNHILGRAENLQWGSMREISTMQKSQNVQLLAETIPHWKFLCKVALFWVMAYMWQN